MMGKMRLFKTSINKYIWTSKLTRESCVSFLFFPRMIRILRIRVSCATVCLIASKLTYFLAQALFFRATHIRQSSGVAPGEYTAPKSQQNSALSDPKWVCHRVSKLCLKKNWSDYTSLKCVNNKKYFNNTR